MHQSNQVSASSLPAQPEFVSISAKVTNIDQWKQLDGVKTRAIIPSGEGWIVTASVRRSDFESISHKPFLDNLQIATEVRPVKT